jgi:hypothetical protein
MNDETLGWGCSLAESRALRFMEGCRRDFWLAEPSEWMPFKTRPCRSPVHQGSVQASARKSFGGKRCSLARSRHTVSTLGGASMSDPSVRGQDHLSAYQLRASDSSQSRKGRRRKGSLPPPPSPLFPPAQGLLRAQNSGERRRCRPSSAFLVVLSRLMARSGF